MHRRDLDVNQEKRANCFEAALLTGAMLVGLSILDINGPQIFFGYPEPSYKHNVGLDGFSYDTKSDLLEANFRYRTQRAHTLRHLGSSNG